MKYYSFGELQEELKKAGLPHNRKTLLKWEKQGRLVSPRSSTNYKVLKGEKFYVRMYREDQVKEIIKAFQPEGSGFWSPKPEGEAP